MSHIFKMENWYDPVTATHHCNDVHVKGGGVWWLVPRMLQMDPAEYVEMLVKRFNADLTYCKDKNVLIKSWRRQEDCRKFKNWVNQQARERQFYVED